MKTQGLTPDQREKFRRLNWDIYTGTRTQEPEKEDKHPESCVLEISKRQDKWDRHFLNISLQHAMLSKDPRTQVGSVIVGPDRELLSAGFNGFPRGIEDTEDRLNDRDLKLKLVVHAEMNAILAAARNGVRLKGCTLYLAATKIETGKVWGGPPCTRCTVEILQAGITEIVSHPVKDEPSKWHDDLRLARVLIDEAGVKYREVSHQANSEGEEWKL